MCISFPKTPEKLTTTEQNILEYIIKHRDIFICMSIGELSSKLNISEATISRFAKHIGCTDFKHLKRIVAQQTLKNGPAKKLTNTLQTGNGNILGHFMEKQIYNIQKTFEFLQKSDFENAVNALKQSKRVFIFAKNASRSPAQLLEFRLRRLGLNVHRINHGGTELLEDLSLINKDDLIIIFGFSKITSEGKIILDYKQKIGYKTLLFTGKMYHNEQYNADINLFIYRGEENEYHSMSAPIAIVDAVILALSESMGTKAVDSLENIRKLKENYIKLM